MDLWYARPGDVVVAKIDLKNGAVGIVPPDWANIVVTGHFAVYQLDPDQIESAYFQRIIQAAFFKRYLWQNKVGAEGRKEVKLALFESTLIPLPPLPTQRAIVEHWQAGQRRVAALREAADAREAAITREFLAALGLEERLAGINRRAFSLRWAEIDRWSIGFIRQAAGNLDPAGGRYPVVALSDVVADLSNGWSPKCHSRPAVDNEWGVLKLGAVSYGTFDENENKALPPGLQPVPALEIKAGDVLISRANIPRLVGACALVQSTRPNLLLCDKIFRVVFRPDHPILPEYLAEVMKLPHLRRQIESSVTGSSPTMQNITKPALLALRFPLPSLDVQRELAGRIAAARGEIVAGRAEATRLAAETAREVEAMILGRRAVGD